MTDHIEKTKQMISVMQAYVDGKPIEADPRLTMAVKAQICTDPVWNWHSCEYRIATTPDTIDWSHVAPKWQFMARDELGEPNFFTSKPCVMVKAGLWRGSTEYLRANNFASYRAGTCDWKDSLVRRPE